MAKAKRKAKRAIGLSEPDLKSTLKLIAEQHASIVDDAERMGEEAGCVLAERVPSAHDFRVNPMLAESELDGVENSLDEIVGRAHGIIDTFKHLERNIKTARRFIEKMSHE